MSLTLKQKFGLVMLIAVVCTGGLALTAIIAMNTILNAQHQINSLSEVADSSMELQIELYGARELANRLSPDTLDAMRSQLDAVASDYRSALADAAANADIQAINAATPAILAGLDEHIATMQRWLALKQDFGLSPTDGLLGQLNRTAEGLSQGTSNFSGLAGQFQTVRQHEKDFLLTADQSEVAAALEGLATLRNDLADFDFDKYVALTDQYKSLFTQLGNGYGELLELERQQRTQVTALIEKTGELEHLIEDELMTAARNDAESAGAKAQPMIIGTGILAIGLIAGLLFTTGRSANIGLGRTMDALHRAAAGDLSDEMDDSKHDEFGDLARSVNTMNRDLTGVIRSVTDTSTELSGMSDNLSNAIGRVSSGNRHIADKATSLAAATEQMSATVGEVSHTTHQVNDATNRARKSATEGGKVINGAIRALGDVAETVNGAAAQMTELGERTERIDVVIEVIRGVAEQTNLLALNAAIEAARAGEAGRGFAVVADEVRSLAEKTVQASNEITEIVQDLQQGARSAIDAITLGKERAEQGNQHGASAAEAVTQIEQQVAEASSGTDQIAVAIEELSSTVKEMASNMEEISNSVNAGSGEINDIVGTSQQVAKKATELKQLTARFKLS